MGLNSIIPAANMSFSTSRGPSPAIWQDCPRENLIARPELGQYFFEDFDQVGGHVSTGSAVIGPVGKMAAYIYAGGAVADGAAEGGVVTISSDGDNEGVALGSTVGSFRITTTSTLALNQKLWFETRISLSTVTATKNDAFVGLFDKFGSTTGVPQAAFPISTTDDTLSTTPNLIGFMRKGTAAPTEWQFVYQLAGGTAVFPTNLTTLMNTVTGAVATAGGWVKLGFLFDPNAPFERISSASTGQTAGQTAKPLIKVFVNGKPAPAFLTSTNVAGTSFPTGFMAPGVAIMNQTGSTPGSLSCDWIGCANLANS